MIIRVEIVPNVVIVAVEREADDEPETAIKHASYAFAQPSALHSMN